MGAFQFGHISTFARKPKSGKNGASRSVSEILNEAMRTQENCPHVKNPQPPVQLAGLTPQQLIDGLDGLLDERKIEGKRKPRGDVHVLAAAVYSWPENTDYYDKKRLKSWIKDQLAWHEKHVGGVDCAVLHLDESHPHIHCYTVDPDARRLCIGDKEKRRVLEAGGKNKEANLAFRNAMKDWQDNLFQEVGRYHGLERLGPKRQRLTRGEWRQAKGVRLDAGDRLRALREAGQQADLLAKIETPKIIIKTPETPSNLTAKITPERLFTGRFGSEIEALDFETAKDLMSQSHKIGVEAGIEAAKQGFKSVEKLLEGAKMLDLRNKEATEKKVLLERENWAQKQLIDEQNELLAAIPAAQIEAIQQEIQRKNTNEWCKSELRDAIWQAIYQDAPEIERNSNIVTVTKIINYSDMLGYLENSPDFDNETAEKAISLLADLYQIPPQQRPTVRSNQESAQTPHQPLENAPKRVKNDSSDDLSM